MEYRSKIMDVIESIDGDTIIPLAIKIDGSFKRIISINQIIRGLTSKSHDFGYCYDVTLETKRSIRLFYRLSDHAWFVEQLIHDENDAVIR